MSFYYSVRQRVSNVKRMYARERNMRRGLAVASAIGREFLTRFSGHAQNDRLISRRQLDFAVYTRDGVLP